MIFFKESGHVSCERVNDVLTITWLKFGSDELVQRCCTSQLEQVKQGAKIIIIDTRNTKGFITTQTNTWFQEKLFPDMQKAGIKAMITILSPNDAIVRLSSRQWKRAASPFGFAMYDAQTLDDANELAQKILAGEPID